MACEGIVILAGASEAGCSTEDIGSEAIGSAPGGFNGASVPLGPDDW